MMIVIYDLHIFIGEATGLTPKSYTTHERSAREKHSSLFQTFINYSCKKLYDIGP
jgi:hypothetical protein